MADMNKILIYHEWWESLKDLSYEDKGMIMEAIFKYGMTGEHELTGYLAVIFKFLKNRLDADKTAYQEACDRNRDIALAREEAKRHAKAPQSTSVHDGAPQSTASTKSNSNSKSKSKERDLSISIQAEEIPEDIKQFISLDSPQVSYRHNLSPEKFRAGQKSALDKLLKTYPMDQIQLVCQFIKQDDFRVKQIQTIKKLSEKDKNGIPWMIRMLEKIKQWKPKVVDLDAKPHPHEEGN